MASPRIFLAKLDVNLRLNITNRGTTAPPVIHHARHQKSVSVRDNDRVVGIFEGPTTSRKQVYVKSLHPNNLCG